MTTEFNDWIAFTSPGVCPVDKGVMGQTQCADETREQAEGHQVEELSSRSWGCDADAPFRICFYRTVKSVEFGDWEAFNSPGECPVDGDTLVRAQCRYETRDHAEKIPPFKAKVWNWSMSNSSDKSIIAYQRVKESEPLDPDWREVSFNAQHLKVAANKFGCAFNVDNAVQHFKRIADALGYDISKRGAQ